jgi:aminoglycoside phosphotransferase (APT) family kinase protein
MNGKMHRDELPITLDLVRRLLDQQFPEYRKLPLSRLTASGSSNVHFLLGDDLLVRMPRLRGGGAAIAKECRWLPTIRQHLPVAVPEVVAIGEPAPRYDEQWALLSWLEGEHPPVSMPEDEPSPESRRLAEDLADLVTAFRGIEVPQDAVEDERLWAPYRGRPLADYDDQMRKNIEACRSIDGLDLDLDAATSIWNRALHLPGADATDGHLRWFHGDIVAENLLCVGGRMTALLDFGGIGLGDPTVDLHGAWEILDPAAREVFHSRLQVDDSEWLRGRAWALAVALMTFPYYWATMPRRVLDRLAMARAVLSDPQ